MSDVAYKISEDLPRAKQSRPKDSKPVTSETQEELIMKKEFQMTPKKTKPLRLDISRHSILAFGII